MLHGLGRRAAVPPRLDISAALRSRNGTNPTQSPRSPQSPGSPDSPDSPDSPGSPGSPAPQEQQQQQPESPNSPNSPTSPGGFPNNTTTTTTQPPPAAATTLQTVVTSATSSATSVPGIVLPDVTGVPSRAGQEGVTPGAMDDGSGDGDGGLSSGAIAGIVIGVVAAIALLALLFWRYKREYADNTTVVSSASARSKRLLARIKGVAGSASPHGNQPPVVMVPSGPPVLGGQGLQRQEMQQQQRTQSQVMDEPIQESWRQEEGYLAPTRTTEYFVPGGKRNGEDDGDWEERAEYDETPVPIVAVASPQEQQQPQQDKTFEYGAAAQRTEPDDGGAAERTEPGNGGWAKKPKSTIINWLSTAATGSHLHPDDAENGNGGVRRSRWWRNTGITQASAPSSVSTERQMWG